MGHNNIVGNSLEMAPAACELACSKTKTHLVMQAVKIRDFGVKIMILWETNSLYRDGVIRESRLVPRRLARYTSAWIQASGRHGHKRV